MANLRKRMLEEEHEIALAARLVTPADNHAPISGDAMRAILDHVADAARKSGIAEGKRWSAGSESKRIWQKLKNEEIKHRKEGRVDIADVLGAIRKWINCNDD